MTPPMQNSETSGYNEVSITRDTEIYNEKQTNCEAALPAELISAGSQHLHRRLGGKEVQLMAIGGAIGTSLFVQMGAVLPKGGPAGLFLAFCVYGTIIMSVSQCFAEMITYMPIASPFVRLAGFWVGDALSFAMVWNYSFLMAFSVPYETTAIVVLLTYWIDKVHIAWFTMACMIAFALLNGFTVRWFGISEFYLSSFKVFLMLGLIMCTFVTMLGGNPDGERYGFRYWRDPGAFAEYLAPGNTGRFLGLLSCMVQASFTMVGPEYISMTAPEAQQPRKLMRRAYSSFVWRLMFFFIGGALCVGIVIPYDDPSLARVIAGGEEGSGTGAASPYVISMVNYGIRGLPSLVNALIITSVFSAGNHCVFAATRCLHGLVMEGKAPQVFTKCTKAGIPIHALGLAPMLCLLSLLQLSKSSAKVLSWLVGICTASYLLNYISAVIIYLHFYTATRRQGIDRNTLPYKGVLQPYTAWWALFGTSFMALALGYNVFIKGQWDVTLFVTSYAMVAFFPVAFVFREVVKRTQHVRLGTADLQLGSTKSDIDTYEALYEPPQRGKVSSWFNSWFE